MSQPVAFNRDVKPFPSREFQRRFPFGWGSKRPLCEQFEVDEKHRCQQHNDRHQPVELMRDGQCHPRTAYGDGQRENMIALTRPLEHSTNSTRWSIVLRFGLVVGLTIFSFGLLGFLLRFALFLALDELITEVAHVFKTGPNA